MLFQKLFKTNLETKLCLGWKPSSVLSGNQVLPGGETKLFLGRGGNQALSGVETKLCMWWKPSFAWSGN